MRERVGQLSDQCQRFVGAEVVESRLALIGHGYPDTHEATLP